jgi:hypothetical protein
MKTKKCFKCGEEKELSAFYKHKQMADGHLNKCIVCNKKDVREREEVLRKDPVWIEKEKDRHREKYHRLGYKELHKPSSEDKKRIISKYREKYPEKHEAQNASQKIKPSTEGNELHHWSYNKEHYKDLIELSVSEHNTIHRFMVYDQERKMYRTTEGILLDTRESAIKYYESILQKQINQ